MAQVSKGGTPPSFSEQGVAPSSSGAQQSVSGIPLIDLPVVLDMKKIKEEDEEDKKNGRPPRLGVSISLHNIDLLKEGEWTTLEDGRRVCRLRIKAAGAKALSVYYDQFYIPEGGELYIYNKDRSHVLGAFTNDNNIGRKRFATEYTAGDEVILEYVEPLETEEKPQINKVNNSSNSLLMIPSVKESKSSPIIIISEVGYAYADNVLVVKKENDNPYSLFGLNESASCMVNINCPEGADWQVQKNAVSRLIIYKGGGQYYCSGTLIHNTSRDFSPYIITAYHCFENATPEEIQQTLFYFHYEQPDCGNSVKEPEHKTIVGGSMLVNIPIEAHSDGSLLLLNERIPDDWNLYWSGWDRRNEPMKQGVGIHHPQGDVMKISTVPPDVTVSGQWPAQPVGALNAHWELIFEPTASGFGVVEGGSSGSGLFNQDKRLVGTLTGGSSTCQDPEKPNLYGKLWYHWDQSSDPALHMKGYLDPIDSGVEFMDGEFLTGSTSVNFNVTSSTAYAGEEVYYMNLCYGEDITAWNWEFPGGTPATSTERSPVVVYSAPGRYSAKLTISYTTEEGVKQLVRERANIVTITQKSEPCYAEEIAIGTGIKVSAFPLGSTNVQDYSASIYNKVALNRSGKIEKLLWNASVASDTERKIQIYLKETNDSTFTAGSWDDEIEGAELVYESADDVTVPAGWMEISLPKPFAYTGTRHLKVLVHTVSEGAPYVSSDFYYSEKSNTHMAWSASNTSPVSGNGIVSNRCPNIKIGFADGECGKAPVADFEMLSSPFYTEGFDAYEFPENWTVTKPGVSANQWELGNVLTNPFNRFDPANISSAAISPDPRSSMDTWLISNSITLPAKAANMQFYIGYNAMKSVNFILKLYVSNDDQETWEEIWTTPSGFAQWAWYRVTKKIDQYAGQQVNFAWRVFGTDGDYLVIDNVKLFEDKDRVEIYEGESVSFLDKSTGPPVHWKWDLPGGTPNSETATTVQPVYLNEGVYGVKLSVENNIGKDSLLIENAVSVIARNPIARIYGVGGYTRALNYNKFIPIGATVSYSDTSLYIPKTRTWNFEGGTPNTATDKKVTVQYDTEGEYSVGLTVRNVKGADDTLMDAYVKVGGTDRIWNMPAGDTGESLFTYGEEGDGYLTGVCRTKANKFAEAFAAPQGALSLSKVEIRFMIEGEKVADEKVTVSIYTCAPGTVTVPQKQLAIAVLPVADINTDGYTTVTFSEPAIVTGKYFVVVEGFGSLKTQLAIASSELSFYTWNTSYVYHFETWYSMTGYAGSGIGAALNIVPTVTYIHLIVKSPENYTLAFDDTLSRTVNVESNVTWGITTAQPWILLDKASATGNGSFTFHCIPNIENVDRHGVIILTGGEGVNKRLYVTQTTGDSIIGLDAEVMDDFVSIQLKWGNSIVNQEKAALMSGQKVVLPKIVRNQPADSANYPMVSNIDPSGHSLPETFSAAKSLTWSKGPFVQYLSYSGTKHYQVATLFYPEDLIQYHGGALTTVEFYPYSVATFKVLVYQNEVLVADTALKDVTPATYNRIDISSKGVMIDATQSLRITIDVVAAGNARAITIDAGPAVAGKGNLLNNNMNNEWAPLSDFAGFETSGNWMIGGYVKMDNDFGNYYRLYRNGKPIGETDQTSFVDMKVFIPGEYCYEVSKVSNADNSESPKSNKACVTIKPVITIAVSGLQLDYGYPMPTPEYLGSLYGIWDKGVLGNLKILKEPIIKIREDILPTSPAGIYPNGVLISDLVIEKGELYNIRYLNGSFNHLRRPVSVAAGEDAKKAYGDSDPEAIPYSVTNMVESEQLVGSLSRQPGEEVGTYLLTNGSLNDANNPNYLVELVPGTQFTIIPRPVTVVPDEFSRIYGGMDPEILSYTVQNALEGQSLKGMLMREIGENVGEYDIMQGQLDNVRNPSYDITFRKGRRFSITPREAIVTPNPVSKSYGASDPEITYTVSGLLSNEALNGRLSRMEGENVGQYNIVAGNLSLSNNYQLTLLPGLFTINPVDLSVQAENMNIGLGSLLPRPKYLMKGHRIEDEADLKSIIDNSIYIDADMRPSVGVYDILFGSDFIHKNYHATFTPGKLTVSAMPVTAFIPGSADRENAFFMPEGTTYLKVFSRNGVVVYEGNEPWDGNIKNGTIQPGIYFYTAELADGSTLRGSVEVYKL